MSFHIEDPDDIIQPAVAATVGLLKSALTQGPSIKRIVLLSTCGAVVTEDGASRTYDECDWNDAGIQEVQQKGRATTGKIKYLVSKTLAERAAWEFCAEHREEMRWDLVALNPPWVWGPCLHDVPSLESLNLSMSEWYNTVCEGIKDDIALKTNGYVFRIPKDTAFANPLTSKRSVDRRERPRRSALQSVVRTRSRERANPPCRRTLRVARLG